MRDWPSNQLGSLNCINGRFQRILIRLYVCVLLLFKMKRHFEPTFFSRLLQYFFNEIDTVLKICMKKIHEMFMEIILFFHVLIFLQILH